MSTLIFQPKFRRDVILAWHYIALDYRSRADEWLNTLHRALERLASQPKMGQKHPDLSDDFRFHPFGSYSIVYKPLTNGIQAFRLIHSSRLFKKAWREVT